MSKFAFFGSSLISTLWNGAATYYRGLAEALSRRGHQFTFYEPNAFGRQERPDFFESPSIRSVVYPPTESGALKAIESAQREGADILVKASGVGVLDRFLEQAIIASKQPKQLAILWDVDAPATLDEVNADASHPLRDLIPQYDMVFTYGGGMPVTSGYKRLGAAQCVPIYNALDPETHFRTSRDERFVSDLTFLGNRLPDREARVDQFFFETAAQNPDHQFLLGGSGWQDRAIPRNTRYIGHVPSTLHNALNSSARFVLNINRQSMAAYGFSPPTRIFEAAGAAACIITDEWLGIDHFLEPDREILIAESAADISDYLTQISDVEAFEIGRRARSRILAAHTYDHRAQLVEAIIEGRPIGGLFAEGFVHEGLSA